MNTPHISVRVDPPTLERWRTHCIADGTNTSERLRLLMNVWCDYREEAQESDELETIDVDALRSEYGIDE